MASVVSSLCEIFYSEKADENGPVTMGTAFKDDHDETPADKPCDRIILKEKKDDC